MNNLANEFSEIKSVLNQPPVKTRRAEAEKRLAAIRSYIEDRIKTAPHENGGYNWAGPVSLKGLSDKLDIPLGTLRRDLDQEPIVKVVRGRGEKKAIYLRLSKPGDMGASATERKMANTMSKIWRELYGWKATPPKHYGPLLGLARELPDGWQVRIFEHTAKNWQEFVVETRGFIEAERLIWETGRRDEAQPYDNDEEGNSHDFIARDFHGAHLRYRKVEFVNPAYMLRFHKIASRLFAYHMDDRSKPFPQEVWWR